MQEKIRAETGNSLEHLLQRSGELHDRLSVLLDDVEFDGSPRGDASLGM